MANKVNDVNVTVACHGIDTTVILNGTDISGHVSYIKFEQSADTCNSLTMTLDAVNFDLNGEKVK